MEKLTIEHLAPYLPYGLKTQQLSKLYPCPEIIGIVRNMVYCNYHGVSCSWHIDDIKPLLRPLSDLSKFSDNEDFINEHSINLLIEEKYKLSYGVFSHYKSELNIELDGDSSLRYDANKRIPFSAVMDIQKELLRGHYDIFGLIEKGLAVDLTLTQSAKQSISQ